MNITAFLCLCVIHRVPRSVDLPVLCTGKVTEGLHITYDFPYPEALGCSFLDKVG